MVSTNACNIMGCQFFPTDFFCSPHTPKNHIWPLSLIAKEDWWIQRFEMKALVEGTMVRGARIASQR